MTGKADRDLPPLRLRDVGGGDFRQVGEDLVKVLADHGLKSTDRVLDIGCGVGRVALPRVLRPGGTLCDVLPHRRAHGVYRARFQSRA
ncbi:MAG TPA: hypothetical protein VF846_13660 [Thermoanaerobaculia bacterium]|jgi:hypothetical protein